MRRTSILLVLLLLSGVASAKEWLCVPEKVMSLGSEGEWKTTNVSAPKNWLVAEEQLPDSSASIFYVVRETGGDSTKFLCETEQTGLPQLECYAHELRDRFRFNKNTNIYARTGFLSDLSGETIDHNPLIELGKCSVRSKTG